ncbi:hypothetical protein BOTBODRAFT_59150 [Botryobasidium botryosum FD-172 SS1]|uniref:MYND-type domain-containing protein n=1 Tax=Botryobasidium botryosum (strain FD-172 SS1) TaxID=930990 RepID=A0A067M272_BOTB1|nr:hypothetical protein BOTBODRAFT_59150 [Botryobasidium botryosum FD-172 SS1]
MTQSCEHCFKPEEGSTKLDRCSACRWALYCSRACQSANWYLHKSICRGIVRCNEKIDSFPPGDPERKVLEITAELRKFTGRNRDLLGQAAIQAINLHANHDAPNKLALEVHVQWLPYSARFRVIHAFVQPLEVYANLGDVVQQRALYHHKNKTEDGLMGCILIMIKCGEGSDLPRPVYSFTYCAPDHDGAARAPKFTWMEELIGTIHEEPPLSTAVAW